MRKPAGTIKSGSTIRLGENLYEVRNTLHVDGIPNPVVLLSLKASYSELKIDMRLSQHLELDVVEEPE